jgi:UDP-N-acetylglucosamine 3-dehydrogenase
MMKTLRAAVIGVGAMGSNHARIYSQAEAVELAGVCDMNPRLAKSTGSKYKCKSYTNPDRLLADEKPDIVTVATPTQTHHNVVMSAIESGAAVLVEKPIADTVENAREMIDAARSANVKLMVGHIERFNPAIQELKRRLEKQMLGRVFSIHSTRVGPFPNRIRDVGVVIDLAVHDIDIMRYITSSEVKRVFAESEKRIHTSCEDMLSGIIKFKNQTVGVLDVNWLTPEKIREITVTGERGMFKAKYITQELLFYENLKAQDREYNYQKILMGVSEGDITHIRIKKNEPLKAEIESFINSVRKNTRPPVTGTDGLKALETAHMIIESASKNRVILA